MNILVGISTFNNNGKNEQYNNGVHIIPTSSPLHRLHFNNAIEMLMKEVANIYFISKIRLPTYSNSCLCSSNKIKSGFLNSLFLIINLFKSLIFKHQNISCKNKQAFLVRP